MNTTAKGNAFEKRVGTIIQSMLDNETFSLPVSGTEIFYKKPYHSKDREKPIIFDIAIECKRHPDLPPFFYVLIECKDNNRSISVDEVQNFWASTQQIAGASKPMIFSTSNFQEAALNYARNKGISLIRISADDDQEWFVERTSPYLQADKEMVASLNAFNALLQPYFISTRFNYIGLDNTITFTDVKDILKPLLESDAHNS